MPLNRRVFALQSHGKSLNMGLRLPDAYFVRSATRNKPRHFQQNGALRNVGLPTRVGVE